MERELKALQQRIGYTFGDVHILEQALTHRSYTNEHPRAAHNERLEFLGDAVLGLYVSDALFSRCQASQEGELSRRRAALVNARALARQARALDLGPLLRLGRGEIQSGGASKGSLLADAMEALIGAVYVDGGAQAAHGVLVGILESALNRTVDAQAPHDAKSALQERTQHGGLGLPVYEVLASEGPDHAREYAVQVTVAGSALPTARGTGSSKKRAEHAAAEALLALLDEPA
ncbi:MAG: ribonuclease III [Pseudomonadota bacterium]